MIRRRHRGFALFELLVAMAIFSVLAALAYGGLSSVARTRGELEASGARLKALQLGVAQLGRQLRQAAVNKRSRLLPRIRRNSVARKGAISDTLDGWMRRA